MHTFRIFNFQLFSGEGAASGEGSGGEAAGVNSVDAGQSVLESLGVPAEARERWAKSKRRRGQMTEAVQQITQETENAQNAAEGSDGDPSRGEGAEPDYRQIRNDPRYKKQFDDEIAGVIRKRLANATRDREAMEKRSETDAIMAQYYGLDPVSFTQEELAEKIKADDHFFERESDDKGVDIDTARQNVKDRLELQRLRSEKKQTVDRQVGMAHLDKLRQQAQESKLLQSIPGFSFDEAMADEKFFMLTSPQLGYTPEQAYMCLHGGEVVDSVRSEKNAQAVSLVADTIRAGQGRVKENGAATAVQVGNIPYSQMNREQRAQWLAQKKKEAADRGDRRGFIV